MTPQPVTSYKVEVIIVRRDTGEHIHAYPVEVRHWWSVAREVLGWLSIEVLPYWPYGSLRLVWDDHEMEPRINGSLYGLALTLNLLTDDDYVPQEHAHNPYPDLRSNHLR